MARNNNVSKKKAARPAPVVNSTKNKKKRLRKSKSNKKLARLNRMVKAGEGVDLLAASLSSNVGNTKEVVYTVTDYFDHGVQGSAYFQWKYNNEQSVFSKNGPSDSLCRLLDAEIFALPRFSTATYASPIMVCTTVPVSIGGEQTEVAAGNPQTTLLLPTSNGRWVSVGKYNANQLFSGGTLPGVFGKYQAVFAGCVVDPDTMDVPAKDAIVQFKVVIRVASGLVPATQFAYGLTQSAESSLLANVAQSATSMQIAQIQIESLSNVA